jgi:hypothetical protein
MIVYIRANKKEDYIQEADRLIGTYIQGVLTILEQLGYTEQDILTLAGVYKKVEERNVSSGVMTLFFIKEVLVLSNLS